jgi:hypothetical protein
LRVAVGLPRVRLERAVVASDTELGAGDVGAIAVAVAVRILVVRVRAERVLLTVIESVIVAIGVDGIGDVGIRGDLVAVVEPVAVGVRVERVAEVEGGPRPGCSACRCPRPRRRLRISTEPSWHAGPQL